MKPCFKSILLIIFAFSSLSMVGCGQAPIGPTVQVMPAPGKPLDMYQQEFMKCKQYAFDMIGGQSAVDQVNNQAVTKTLIGVSVGALAGAATGQAVEGNAGPGAQVGAAGGLVAGTGVAAADTANANMTLQQMYDNAFSQCMYSKGNQVPGMAQPTPPPTADESESSQVYSHEKKADPKLLKAQQELKDAGYDPGSVDGLTGRKTKEALSQFQKDHNLKVTGRLNKETLSMLETPQ